MLASVVRPSVCVFSEPVKQINDKFDGKVPFTISPAYFFLFLSKFCIFDFLRFYFVFVNMGPYGKKTSNDISSENT